jgi:hypothetical protein
VYRFVCCVAKCFSKLVKIFFIHCWCCWKIKIQFCIHFIGDNAMKKHYVNTLWRLFGNYECSVVHWTYDQIRFVCRCAVKTFDWLKIFARSKWLLWLWCVAVHMDIHTKNRIHWMRVGQIDQPKVVFTRNSTFLTCHTASYCHTAFPKVCHVGRQKISNISIFCRLTRLALGKQFLCHMANWCCMANWCFM